MKIRFLLLSIAAFLIGSQYAYSQFGLFMPGVSAEIKLSKDTFALGEPFFVNLIIHNDGKRPVFIGRGGEKYGLNREGFNIAVITQTGDTLKPIFPDVAAFSYFHGYHELLPTHKMYFEFFLPRWVSIDEEGIYRMVIAKVLDIHPINPFIENDHSKGIKINTIAEKVFTVIKDDAAMGVFIQKLIDAIKISRNKDGYYDLISTLGEVNDERVIPFLGESLRKNQYLERHFSVQYLCNFRDNEAASQALIFAADSEVNTCCEVFADSIHLSYSSGNIRQSALRGLMQSNRASAFEYLLSTVKEDPTERLFLVYGAAYNLPKIKAKLLLELFTEDEHPYVRRKAREALQKIKDD